MHLHFPSRLTPSFWPACSERIHIHIVTLQTDAALRWLALWSLRRTDWAPRARCSLCFFGLGVVVLK